MLISNQTLLYYIVLFWIQLKNQQLTSTLLNHSTMYFMQTKNKKKTQINSYSRTALLFISNALETFSAPLNRTTGNLLKILID